MPKAPRDKESTTPAKRTRKTAPKSGNGIHAENGNGASTQALTVSPAVSATTQAPSNQHVEEQIRARAYELYLARGGNGGSPEQDWLRAQQEICGQ
jgi:hypothetical protein